MHWWTRRCGSWGRCLLAEGLAKKEASLKQEQWENWVLEACSGGSDKAFRFINRLASGGLEQVAAETVGVSHAAPLPGVVADRELSSDLRVIARAHSEGWAKVWMDSRHGGEVEAPV